MSFFFSILLSFAFSFLSLHLFELLSWSFLSFIIILSIIEFLINFVFHKTTVLCIDSFRWRSCPRWVLQRKLNGCLEHNPKGEELEVVEGCNQLSEEKKVLCCCYLLMSMLLLF